jgi:4-amino-4-deoxy-L-arabinose transferase-like glycosyltransferase
MGLRNVTGGRLHLRLYAIIALAIYLRTVNLSTVPCWMFDEGSNISYAANLMHGRVQHFGYIYHFIPHPPLYFIPLAAAFKMLGADMTVLRLFSVACSIAGLYIVYRIVRRVLGEGYGLLAGLVYALSPELVFWGRLGFANNLLAVSALASMYYLLRFLREGRYRDILVCGALTGLCPLIEYTGVVFIACLGVILYWHARKQLLKTMLISAAPLTIFTAYMLVFDSAGFLRDAGNYYGLYPLALPALIIGLFLFKKFSSYILRLLDSLYYGVGKQTPADLVVYTGLTAFAFIPVSQDLLLAGGTVSFPAFISFIGLFFVYDQHVRSVLFTYFGGYFTLLLAINRWDHMGIPVYYLILCGSVFFVKRAYDYGSRRLSQNTVLLLLALPLALTLAVDVEGFVLRGVHEVPADALRDMSDYVNENTDAGDLVVTYAYLAPQMKGRTVLFSEVLAYNGYRFAYLRRDYTPDDFAYDHSLSNIGYMVLPEGYVEQLDDAEYAAVKDALSEWPVAYRVGVLWQRRRVLGSGILERLGSPMRQRIYYVVYENPRRIR